MGGELKTLKEESGLPSAARFVRDQLRAASYTFETAIADLVDNSISAGARNIQLEVDEDNLEVFLFDDGFGMNDETHFESMKVAAETRDYEDADLGKYGTGMKAASLSQARRLIVATRAQKSKTITVRCLDVDHVIRTNDWDRVTQVLSPESLPVRVKEHLEKTHGTVIYWQSLDKVFGDMDLSDEQKSQELFEQAASTADHLSVVFHKFMQGTTRFDYPIDFYVNGSKVEPWDPYAKDETSKKIREIELGIGAGTKTVKVTAWVLPTEREFSTSLARLKAKGPKSWNDSQGFYVYRNDRLISYGGWFGMRAKEPHKALARVAFEFDSDLDTTLHVPVNKSSVTFPKTLKSELEDLVKDVSKAAEERYRNQTRATRVSTAALKKASLVQVATRKVSAETFYKALKRTAELNHLEKELRKLMSALRATDKPMADEVEG